MNKKGFTLVEILAVIVILSLVITITATKGFGVFDNTKNKITEQNKKAIKEGAKVLITEVENCDDDLGDYKDLCNVFEIDNSICSNCDALKKNINTRGVAISTLKEKNYISGNDLNDIEGYVNISFDKDKNEGSVDISNIYLNNGNEIYNPVIYSFVSNNKNSHTVAKTKLSFVPIEDGTLIIEGKTSGGTRFGKADTTYIYLNNQKLVEANHNRNFTLEENLEKNKEYVLEFQYKKESSTVSDDYAGTISSLKITSRLKNGLNIENDEYYFEKSETVENNK